MKIRFLLIILIAFFYSCDSSLVFEKNKEVSKSGWNKNDIMKFNTEINNIKIPYNYFINIRITYDYQFSNIFLFVKTLFPDGKFSCDTIECFFADIDGKWLGKTSGRFIDNRIPFKRNVIFPQVGTYSFEFEQAMRTDNLSGIEDFGIRIEKVK